MIGGLWSPERRALSGGLVLTVTLVASEALAVGTVMPLVARDLGGLELYGWVFSAFFLATLVGIVISGGLVDRGTGLAPLLAFGLICFAVGLALAGLAPSMPLLILARVLQGIGAGFEPPVAYVAIRRVLPSHLRPQMFAVLSTAWVIPGLIGPALAGLVGDTLGWRWVFLALLPLIGLAAAITVPALAAVDRRAEPAPAGVRDPDRAAAGPDAGWSEPSPSGAAHAPGEEAYPGHVPRPDDGRRADDLRVRAFLALAIAGGAGLALAGLGALAGTPAAGAAMLAVGIGVGLPAFRRLTPSGTLVARPVLPAAVLLRGLLTFAFFAADAYVPLALVEVRGTTAATAGLALTAATLAWTAGAWIQARVIGQIGARTLVGWGFLVVIGGLVITATVLVPSVPLPLGIAGWGVAGLGMGLAYAPLSVTVLHEARAGEEGLATAGLQLSDVVGTGLGTGVGGALLAVIGGATAGVVLDPGRTAAGVAAAFAAGAAVGLVGLALSGRLGPRPTGQVGPPLR